MIAAAGMQDEILCMGARRAVDGLLRGLCLGCARLVAAVGGGVQPIEPPLVRGPDGTVSCVAHVAVRSGWRTA